MKVLGLISGTSHDGVDHAVVEFTQDGTVLTGEILDAGTEGYPAALRERLIAALPPAQVPLAEVCALDTLLGQHFAARAAQVISAQPADVVCSHGQTVFHWVQGRQALGTLQWGAPAWIAEATGRPVVSDLRSRDIAAGGHGAPLVPILDTLLLGDRPNRTAVLNLGGIANMTVLDGEGGATAWDLGPANALIDAAVRDQTSGSQSFDLDGRLAAQGTVDATLLSDLLAEPYYRQPAPKSTGKELFNARYLADFAQRHPTVRGADLVATLTALTATVVARDLRAAGVAGVLASGGGVANPTLMAMLGRELPDVPVQTTDTVGAPAETKEAIAFALIGYLSMLGLPGNVPSCTGAAGPRVLGSLTPGSQRLPVPTDVPMPTRLVLQ